MHRYTLRSGSGNKLCSSFYKVRDGKGSVVLFYPGAAEIRWEERTVPKFKLISTGTIYRKKPAFFSCGEENPNIVGLGSDSVFISTTLDEIKNHPKNVRNSKALANSYTTSYFGLSNRAPNSLLGGNGEYCIEESFSVMEYCPSTETLLLLSAVGARNLFKVTLIPMGGTKSGEERCSKDIGLLELKTGAWPTLYRSGPGEFTFLGNYSKEMVVFSVEKLLSHGFSQGAERIPLDWVVPSLASACFNPESKNICGLFMNGSPDVLEIPNEGKHNLVPIDVKKYRSEIEGKEISSFYCPKLGIVYFFAETPYRGYPSLFLAIENNHELSKLNISSFSPTGKNPSIFKRIMKRRGNIPKSHELLSVTTYNYIFLKNRMLELGINPSILRGKKSFTLLIANMGEDIMVRVLATGKEFPTEAAPELRVPREEWENIFSTEKGYRSSKYRSVFDILRYTYPRNRTLGL